MYPRRPLPDPVLRLAAEQSGVVSRGQLLGLGVSEEQLRRLVRGWQWLAPGVYRIATGFEPPSFLARVWAGILLGGDGARAGGMTAALLDGLADRGVTRRGAADCRADQEVHILVPDRVILPRDGYRFRREQPGVRQACPRSEPPRTRIEDTTLDLCAAGTEADVVTWVTRACQRRLTTPARLAARLAARPTLRHRSTVRALVDDAAHGVTSHLEHRARHTVFLRHGLPEVTYQAPIGGGRVADALFERFGVVVELDGRVGHVEEGAFRDRERDNAHTVAGLVTLRFGWWDVVDDPCGVAAQIRTVLASRGWVPGPNPCPGCRARLTPPAGARWPARGG